MVLDAAERGVFRTVLKGLDYVHAAPEGLDCVHAALKGWTTWSAGSAPGGLQQQQLTVFHRVRHRRRGWRMGLDVEEP